MANKTGHCHCGAVQFEIEFNGEFQNLRRCDCSFCSMRWAAVASVPVEKLKVLKGGDSLTLYQWGTKTAKHYFCSICGIYTHHRRRSDPSEYGINVACFDDVDVSDHMAVPYVDGKNHPSDKD
jgi:hypothetical protein